MPCNTRATITVSEKAEKLNLRRLGIVLEADGWSATVTASSVAASKGALTFLFADGTMAINSQYLSQRQLKEQIRKIKQRYAAATVEEGLKRFGWKVTEQRQGNKIHIKGRR